MFSLSSTQVRSKLRSNTKIYIEEGQLVYENSDGFITVLNKYFLNACLMQVLLGRSTDDIDVDIDLRKEGLANKISRRQVGYWNQFLLSLVSLSLKVIC